VKEKKEQRLLLRETRTGTVELRAGLDDERDMATRDVNTAEGGDRNEDDPPRRQCSAAYALEPKMKNWQKFPNPRAVYYPEETIQTRDGNEGQRESGGVQGLLEGRRVPETQVPNTQEGEAAWVSSAVV